MPVARTTSETPVYFSQTDEDRLTPIDSFTAFLGRSSDAARRPFLSRLSISAQVIVHLSHLKSLLHLSLSLSLGNSLSFSHQRFNLSCHAVLIVPSHFSYNQGSDTIDHPITLFVPQTLTASYSICCPCPWNPHISLINPYSPLLYNHGSPFNLCRCIELRVHVSYLGKGIQKSLQTL